jgi:hypothetical protein
MVSPKFVSLGISMSYRFAIGVFLLVCAAAGCRDPGSARYEGSVENTSREQTGAGRLTVFSRTDSTFGGWRCF